jgi:hypothetical protein
MNFLASLQLPTPSAHRARTEVTMTNRILLATALIGLGVCGGGCDDKPQAPLAPTATTLASAKPAPKHAQAYRVTSKGSKVDFAMEAPQEKIRGKVHDSTQGTLHIDIDDLRKSKAHLVANISGIVLFRRPKATEGFSEEEKQPLQNKHARDWLEIGEDVPAGIKEKNVRVEFSVDTIETKTPKLSALKGTVRKVNLTVTGDFLLHGRVAKQSAEIEATFEMKGDVPTQVSLKTVKPFDIDLAQYDVRPRTAFGKLAAKTLGALAPKVAKAASVSFAFTAVHQGQAKAKSTMKAGAAGSAAAAKAAGAPSAAASSQ